jgi:Asp-tRNA(Asn)/Glu-tRNA(Gln) amidotransferase A subunit family amidase
VSHPQDLSLREQALAIAAGDLDPAELLAATQARIDERDGPLNSIVARFAEESERMLASAPRGPLYGVPIAVKDMFALPWRGPRDGSPREVLPAGESGVYRLLRDAGAVIVGVTQMHLWGGGSTGISSAYGPVGNPWNHEHVGGGSSGGSASAVGARLVAGAVGTDGGGSVRLPAAFCGITGLKTTNSTVDKTGYTHGYSTMGAIGPMTRDAADARLLGSVLLDRELVAGSPREDLTVGLVRDPFWSDNDPEANSAAQAALDAAGWRTVDVSIDFAELSLIATVLRLTLEGLPGITPEEIEDADPIMRALVKYERLLPAEALVRADRVRSALRRSTLAAFESGCDLLAWPTIAAPAPRIDNPTVELPSGPMPCDAAMVRQTGHGNLTGVPGISVPAGLHSNGMPLGLQLIAPWGSEELLLDAAEHVERATDRAHVDAVPPAATYAGT